VPDVLVPCYQAVDLRYGSLLVAQHFDRNICDHHKVRFGSLLTANQSDMVPCFEVTTIVFWHFNIDRSDLVPCLMSAMVADAEVVPC
jgi:hypothetical protein